MFEPVSPNRMSLPLLPKIVSSPGPPSSVSLPLPPIRRSSSPRPKADCLPLPRSRKVRPLGADHDGHAHRAFLVAAGILGAAALALAVRQVVLVAALEPATLDRRRDIRVVVQIGGLVEQGVGVAAFLLAVAHVVGKRADHLALAHRLGDVRVGLQVIEPVEARQAVGVAAVARPALGLAEQQPMRLAVGEEAGVDRAGHIGVVR